MSDTKQPHLIQSISRAAAILRCFDGVQELGLTDISRRLGLHKSTASGLIGTLKAEGLLEQNEKNGKYRLGLDLFRLAANSKTGLQEVCDPYIDALLEATGETVNLAVQDGTQILYVCCRESAHSMRISSRVGSRQPLYCTAVGKAMLSVMDPRKARSLLEAAAMAPRTRHTITDPDRLLEHLAAVREEGVAYDLEELEYGVVCMAAPIYCRPGSPVGAVSVSGPTLRMGTRPAGSMAARLRETAPAINRELYRVALP